MKINKSELLIGIMILIIAIVSICLYSIFDALKGLL